MAEEQVTEETPEETAPEAELSDLERAAAEFFQEAIVDPDAADETDVPGEGETSATPDPGSSSAEGVAAAAAPPSAEDSGQTPPADPPVEHQDELEYEPGQKIAKAQVKAYAEFDQLLRTDPGLAQAISAYLQGAGGQSPAGQAPGEGSAPAAPASPALADELDLDDPAIKALYELTQQQGKQLQGLSEQLQTHSTELYNRRLEELTATTNRAAETFKTQHSLDDNQMQKIREVASRLEVLPALMKGVNPLTGVHEAVDTVTAVERAFELAYWQMPEFRDKEYQARLEQWRADKSRKQKLAGVSGSSGSVPRTPSKPRDETEMRKALIKEVAEMQTGNWINPEG